jgi:hypothetical protein
VSEQDDIRRVIDDTLAKSLQQHTAAEQLRRDATLERAAAAYERRTAEVWHEKARRAFWCCAAALGANLVALVLQLLLGFRL